MKSNFKIGIIGGNGSMGTFFKNFFIKNNLEVFFSDINTSISNCSVAKNSDIILLSVPLDKYEDILKEIKDCLNSEQLLMDIGSLKYNQIKLIKKYFKGNILATHPLFGPDENFQIKNFIICDYKNSEKGDFIIKILKKNNFNITFLSSQEHDEIMSYIHSFYYFVNVSYLKLLKDKFKEKKMLENIKTTSFKNFENNLNSIFNTPLWLIEQLIFENPFFKDRLSEFQEILKNYKKINLQEVKKFADFRD